MSDIDSKIEYQEVIGEINPGGYKSIRFTRVKYKASPTTHIDVRLFQRGYDNEGEEAFYPTKTGFRFLESKFIKFVREYISPMSHADDHFSIDNALENYLQVAYREEVDPFSKLISHYLSKDISLVIDEHIFQKLLESSQKLAPDNVLRLIDWVASFARTEDIVNVLEKLKIEDLRKINAAIDLENLKSILTIWKENQNNSNEEFWQNLLEKNLFIFAQVFSFPVILLEGKAYVGGKSIGNSGGKFVDFLCANTLTKNVALIEIKTPVTKLLGARYRGDVYNISSELSGSVIQVTNYKNSLLQNYVALVNSEDSVFETFNPRCIVIIGNLHRELVEKKQRKSLELFRMGLKDVQIITYDELFGKVEFLVNLLEGKKEVDFR